MLMQHLMSPKGFRWDVLMPRFGASLPENLNLGKREENWMGPW